MKRMIVACVVLLALCGCGKVVVNYNPETKLVHAEKTGFFMDNSVKGFLAEIGEGTAHVEWSESESAVSAETLRAMVEAAVAGAVRGVTP